MGSHDGMFIVDNGWIDLEGKVLADVEAGHLGIDIGVDDGKSVNAYHAEHAEVAITAVVILLALEEVFEAVSVGVDVVGKSRPIKSPPRSEFKREEMLLGGGTPVLLGWWSYDSKRR